MTRKIFTLFSLMLTVAFVLAACGPAATTAPATAAPPLLCLPRRASHRCASNCRASHRCTSNCRAYCQAGYS